VEHQLSVGMITGLHRQRPARCFDGIALRSLIAAKSGAFVDLAFTQV